MATKFPYTVFIMAVVVVILAAYQSRSASVNDRTETISSKRAVKHPCDNVENGTVIPAPDGNVVCMLPNNEKLQKELDVTGGYNRHYVAASMKEAKMKFKNLFETYGKNYSNTSAWQTWRHLSLSKVEKIDSGALQMQKREVDNNTNIQCLNGGRETAEGIHFCPACQRCTEMPGNVFPRYVNELTCDDSESGSSIIPGCFLANSFQIGNCRQIKMTIDLLIHQEGNYQLTFENSTIKIYEAVYEPHTIDLRISCECMGFPNLVRNEEGQAPEELHWI